MRFLLGFLLGYSIRGKKPLLIATLTEMARIFDGWQRGTIGLTRCKKVFQLNVIERDMLRSHKTSCLTRKNIWPARN
ncbi:MAG TPA: hypothetical protein VG324_17780, partial [Blastocatellia bacterium]|nr:hypothetical protein [Blastocatellia bacterium]